jgi:hypothetical protein
LIYVQIEQAIYGSQDAGGYRFLARSAGFLDEWLTEAERLCTGFGERPAGVACPSCVFARPFGRRHVAVVQVADRGPDDAGRPGALGFYLLVLPQALYLDVGGDPFFVAEQFPPPWQARGELPALNWTAGAPPARTVAFLQQTLNVPHSATLLGGAQILLDGGQMVFERTSPDAAILRSLWALLPNGTRAELWPASFAFSNVHGFDAVVVPRASGPEYEHYVSEEKAGDYPEGRYECNLQSAIETGDQGEIDALLKPRRRSWKFFVEVLLLLIVVALAARFTVLKPEPRKNAATATAKTAPLELPPENECRTLDVHERTQLAARLHELGQRLNVELPGGTSDEDLTAALAALDQRLPASDHRTLRDFGPLQRQLRFLLWKHGVKDYSARGLNTVELVERLQQRLDEEKKEVEK